MRGQVKLWQFCLGNTITTLELLELWTPNKFLMVRPIFDKIVRMMQSGNSRGNPLNFNKNSKKGHFPPMGFPRTFDIL